MQPTHGPSQGGMSGGYNNQDQPDFPAHQQQQAASRQSGRLHPYSQRSRQNHGQANRQTSFQPSRQPNPQPNLQSNSLTNRQDTYQDYDRTEQNMSNPSQVVRQASGEQAQIIGLLEAINTSIQCLVDTQRCCEERFWQEFNRKQRELDRRHEDLNKQAERAAAVADITMKLATNVVTFKSIVESTGAINDFHDRTSANAQHMTSPAALAMNSANHSDANGFNNNMNGQGSFNGSAPFMGNMEANFGDN